MTLEEKVGQMLQMDISVILQDSQKSLDLNIQVLAHPVVLCIYPSSLFDFAQELTNLIVKYNVGSFLNSPSSGGPNGNQSCPNVDQWRKIITTIQQVNESRRRAPSNCYYFIFT